MGNRSSHSEADVVLDETLLKIGEMQGWTEEELRSLVRVSSTVIEKDKTQFEHQFVNLRWAGIPPQVLHRIWLFSFALYAKIVEGRKRDKEVDLDRLYQVPPELVQFDERTDQALLHELMRKYSEPSMQKLATTPRMSQVESIVLPASDEEQAKANEARMLPYDLFERNSSRQYNSAVMLSFLSYMKDMSNSRRRKFLWDLFQVNGRLYPGRLLKLGSETAEALGLPFGLHEARAVASLTRHTVRHYVSYTEFVGWCKVYSTVARQEQGHAFSVVLNSFGLVPHFVKVVKRILQMRASKSTQNFSGKVRVDQDLFKSKCEVGGGFLTLRNQRGGRRLFDLVHGCALIDDRKTVIFRPAFGEDVKIRCKNVIARNHLVAAVRSYAAQSSDNSKNRFGSFHPEDNTPVSAQWFVDGAPYFAHLLETLNAATSEVLISDWNMQPELYLVRGEGAGPHTRLDLVLKKKAAEGVKIFILLWWEVSMAVNGTVNWAHVRKVFESDENITVLAHPTNNKMGKWSHHQKFVVVDRRIAYVGGIDLCYGRYDTQSHVMTDENHLAMTFPGKDYYNPSLEACNNLDQPFVDLLDRATQCRMPWHDLQVMVTGSSSVYVARNFVERWNKTLADMDQSSPTIPFDTPAFGAETAVPGYPVHCQVLRSLSSWSGTRKETESSILSAYEHIIQTSKYYLYIENQFYVSSVDVVQNQIANLIVERIAHAVEMGEPFRVVVVMPLHPEGAYSTATPRIVGLWTFRTIQSMSAALKKRCPGVELKNYMTFHCLLKHVVHGNVPYLNMIYVHSKLLMADDRMAVVGSANINDRSMLGDRDSEIAVYLLSCDDHSITMNGEAGFMCSKMLTSWRVNLWREHLGFDHTTDELVEDPFAGARLFDAFSEINAVLAAPVVRIEPHRISQTLEKGLLKLLSDAHVARALQEWVVDKLEDLFDGEDDEGEEGDGGDKGEAASAGDGENVITVENLGRVNARGRVQRVFLEKCNCCKDAPATHAECDMCQESLCSSCALTRDAVGRKVSTEAGSRRNALTPDALKATLQLALGDRHSAKVICHLCMGDVCQTVDEKHKGNLKGNFVEPEKEADEKEADDDESSSSSNNNSSAKKSRAKTLIEMAGGDSAAGSADFMVKSLLRKLCIDWDDEKIAKFISKCQQDRVLARSFLTGDTLKRFQGIRGHIFPFPVHVCPKLKPDILAIAPTDIFI